MHVTLRQLRAFVAVVETASFSDAAKAMHLSQAALSGLIRELESRVGVRLLDRNTRSVSPSVVGEAFEPMARRVLSSLDEALESVTNLKELRRGVVRVAAPEPLSCTLVPDLIASYGSAHPGGCHILLGDGSARFVSESINPITWSNLGNREDGQPLGEF